MQCSWSTTASFFLRRSFGSFTTPHHVATKLTSRNTLGCSRPTSLSLRYFSAVARTTPSNPTTSFPPDSSSITFASATASLSDAQVSRVAARTVRLSIREGEFGDALYVVNSACHSVLRGSLHEEESQESASQLEPIDFGRPVSPRLAAHAFLHGLIRHGHSSKAQTYARLMMQVGIPIKSKTLESILAPPQSSSVIPRFGPFARVIPRKQVSSEPSILQLQTKLVSDECARAAVELLQAARTFGQQRTERMYRVLVSTLLMQGEIIVATLLFVMLIKDWELRKLQDGAAHVSQNDHISYDHLGVPQPSRDNLAAAPYPDLKSMANILDAIDGYIARPTDTESGPFMFQYLQSLAVFAMLLDTGQIHTHRVAAIIRTLSNCPKVKTQVWIIRDGQMVKVKAYTYFHQVLERLIRRLGSSDRPPPILYRRAYNTLLSYALRQQLSPTMASTVLHHMCVARNPPLEPDIVTYNILIRSGTLLRKLRISEEALAALQAAGQRLGKEMLPSDIAVSAGSSAPVSSPVSRGSERTEEVPSRSVSVPSSQLPSSLARLDSEELNLPQQVATPNVRLRPGSSTLTSYVTHIASSGRPEQIASAVFTILPELHLIDHPATNGEPVRLFKRSRKQALQHAVKYGPYFYGALINALVKAGEIGLAERVFILAQQAQRASHSPDFVEGVKPWRLSIHAYTSMMQGYMRLAHRRLPRHQLAKYHAGSELLQTHGTWQPKASHYRTGYAHYVFRLGTRRAAPTFTRHQTSRRNAMLLYQSMVSGGRALLKTLILYNAHPAPAPDAPPFWTEDEDSTDGLRRSTVVPDARFFNAALKLFAPLRQGQRSRAYWRLRLEEQRRKGTKAEGWTPMLHKLALSMVLNGYSIPEAYHYLLVWRWRGPMTTRKPRKESARRPLMFPPKPPETFKATALPTLKMKGLPLRRKRSKPAWWLLRRRRKRRGTAATVSYTV